MWYITVFVAVLIFVVALETRKWNLDQPHSIIFDEVHTSFHLNLYINRKFHMDEEPPLTKLLLTGIALLKGWDGNWIGSEVGSEYPSSMPIWSLRLLPAVCGSVVASVSFLIVRQLNCDMFTALIAPILIIADNAFLVQSRFLFTDGTFPLFISLSVLFALKFLHCSKTNSSIYWWLWLFCTGLSLGCVISTKFLGSMTLLLVAFLILGDFWEKLPDTSHTNSKLLREFSCIIACIFVLPVIIYTSVYYIQFTMLDHSGPQDEHMTSAFLASLKGGLSNLTKDQPVHIAYGSQVTLRPTYKKPCWLYSLNDVYPIRYPDGRGSSHQQQVSCCPTKEVNNWWIIKHPDRNYLHVDSPLQLVRHGDIVQVVHGMTSRVLNSHDVGGPLSPHLHEVSCYIDHNISAPALTLWKVEITNKDSVGNIWTSVTSEIRLVNVNTSHAIRSSEIQLPSWGHHHYEVVADKLIQQTPTLWNVEEHKYTTAPQNHNQSKHNETTSSNNTSHEHVSYNYTEGSNRPLGFWAKFFEVQFKVLTAETVPVEHVYGSKPLDWLLCSKNVAYWKSKTSNRQIHFVGNLVIWYSSTCAVIIYVGFLLFYLMRKRRGFTDISTENWSIFIKFGKVCQLGYLLHLLPYILTEHTLHLYHYLPALLYSIWLLTALLAYVSSYFRRKNSSVLFYNCVIVVWLSAAISVYVKLLPICYGHEDLNKQQLQDLMLKESWLFFL